MRLPLLALLCVLVLTAGCGSFAGGGEDERTLTPAPVPSQPTETEVSPDGIAPGLSATNVTDVERLANSHVAVAENASFHWQTTFEQGTWIDGELVDSTNRTTILRKNATRVSRRTVMVQNDVGPSEAAGARPEFATAEYVTLSDHLSMIRNDPSEEPTFRRGATTRQRWGYNALSADAIREQLQLNDTGVYSVGVGERPHYLVNGTRSSVSPYGSVEDYRARAIIREDGFVRSLRVDFNVTFDGDYHHVTYTSEFSEVGTATVPEPEWVQRARNALENETERD